MNPGLRARAAAAALGLFGFNPGQRRGPDGRWIKMGGSGSAGGKPRGRQRRSALNRDGAPRWLEQPPGSLTGQSFDEVAQLFGYDDPQTGYRASVTQASVGDNRVDVVVEIRDSEDRRVGGAGRTFFKDPDGKLVVEHDHFGLEKRAQGGGFSTRWLRQLEDRYRQQGVDKIKVATVGVGGYAWAKAGFDFAGRRSMLQTADRLELRSEAPVHVFGDSPQVKQQMVDLVARARSDDPSEWPLPIEIAMVGWEPGAKTWPGKDVMVNAMWNGVKQL